MSVLYAASAYKKQLDLWVVECLLSQLERWAPTSSLTNLILLGRLFSTCCYKTLYDLTFLQIDNQCLSLQCCAAIFVSTFDGKTN